MSVHARLSCSNLRWPICPGSIAMESQYPESPSNAASISGTLSHVLLETCVDNNKQTSDYIGQRVFDDQDNDCIADKERAARVQVCLDYIKQRQNHYSTVFPGALILVDAETRSNPGKYFNRSDWWGTCDVTITVTIDINVVAIEVIDYKDGFNKVNVTDNSQLIAYLFGKSYPHGYVEMLTMTIVQPKIKYIGSQDWNSHSLFQVAQKLNNAAIQTDNPDAELKAGGHCKYCQHKPNCEQVTTQQIGVIEDMDDRGIIKRVHSELETMSDEILSQILNSEKVFMDAFVKAKTEATRRIENGNHINGYFLGKGPSKSVWNEVPDAIAKKLKGMKVLKDDIYPAKLISPSQAKKLKITETQLKNLEKLISTVDGKITLKKGEKQHPKELFKNVIPTSFI